MATRRMKTRTVTGPAVGSVALIARPPRTIPADHLILEARRQEDVRQLATAIVREDAKFRALVRVFSILQECMRKWEVTLSIAAGAF